MPSGCGPPPCAPPAIGCSGSVPLVGLPPVGGPAVVGVVSAGGLPAVGEGTGGEPPAVGVVTIGSALAGADPRGEAPDGALEAGAAVAGAGAGGVLSRPPRALHMAGQEDVGGATARVLEAQAVPPPRGIDAPNGVLDTIEPALT